MKNEDVTIKQYLGQVFDIDKYNRHYKNQIIENLPENRTLVMTTGNITSVPSGKNSYPESSVENAVIRASEKINECKKQINENEKILNEIYSLIETIDDMKSLLVLRARYKELKPWKAISKELNYSVQHILRIHNAALEKLSVPEAQKNRSLIVW